MDDSKRLVLGGSDRRSEGPSSDWPDSSNPRVGTSRRGLISRDDARLIPWEGMYAESPHQRRLIDEQLKEVERDKYLCPTRRLEELAEDTVFVFFCRGLHDVWEHPFYPAIFPYAGRILLAAELMHAVRLLHRQRPSWGVDLRYLRGVGVGLAWRKGTDEFLGVSPGFIETEYYDGVLHVTNPQWPQPILGAHVLDDGHAFAAELRKQGIECDGAELNVLLEAGLRDRLIAIALPEDCYIVEGAA